MDSAFSHRLACGLVLKNIRCRVPLTLPSTSHRFSPRFVIYLTFIVRNFGLPLAAKNDVLPFAEIVKQERYRVPLLGC